MSDATAPQTNPADAPPPEGQAPAAAGKAGKKVAAPAPAPAPAKPPGKTEDDLLAAYDRADAGLTAARAAVVAAEAARQAAAKDLGAFVIPPGAKRFDRFHIWVGSGATRRMLTITPGKDGNFSVAPYGEGAAPAA